MREGARIKRLVAVASAVWPLAAPALATALGIPIATGISVAACHRSKADPHAGVVPPAAVASAQAPPPTIANVGIPCGPLACTQYDDPRAAFLEAIASAPLALGLGEAHAPKGAQVPSAARRFTQDLLPALAPRASDLVLELMFPPSGCADAAAAVHRAQAPVIAQEAPTNQNEYIAMGERARALGVVPDGLRPTCADMNAIATAGDDAVGVELETIARLAATQAKKLIARAAASAEDRGKMVVLYGGALHNTLADATAGALPFAAPADAGGAGESARWSYAPVVNDAVAGRFVAVDLIVPEFIGDDATWRALPWWPYYDARRLGSKTTLFRLGAKTFVLVFAKTAVEPR
jgi:hypothetical protein